MDNENLPVIEVEGVRGYVDKNNVAWLNAEDVARGLGFVHKETKNGVEYSTVRWATVNNYLKEFGFANKVAKDDFIPENMFYRLAMKASNAAAQKFQAKVADEIMPSIRRDGFYSVYETEIYNIELEKKNMADERVRLEIERAKFELARQRLENDIIEQRLAIASKLHEFAMETKNDEFYREIMWHAIGILINKNL